MMNAVKVEPADVAVPQMSGLAIMETTDRTDYDNMQLHLQSKKETNFLVHGHDRYGIIEDNLTNQRVCGEVLMRDSVCNPVGQIDSQNDVSGSRVQVVPTFGTMSILSDQTVLMSLAEETAVESSTSQVAFGALAVDMRPIPGEQSRRRPARRCRKMDEITRKNDKTGQQIRLRENVSESLEQVRDSGTENTNAKVPGNAKLNIRTKWISRKKAPMSSTCNRSVLGKKSVFADSDLTSDLGDEVARITGVRKKRTSRRCLRSSKKTGTTEMATSKIQRSCKNEIRKKKTEDKSSAIRGPLKMRFKLRNKLKKQTPGSVQLVTSSKTTRRRHKGEQKGRSSECDLDDTSDVGKAPRGKQTKNSNTKVSSRNCFTTKASMVENNKIASNMSKANYYQCTVCGKSYSRKHHFERHLVSHSSSRKPFSCSTCGKKFTRRQQVKIHEEIHQDFRTNEHKCSICGKEFWKKVYLQRHMKTHSSEKPFECPTCGKCFVLERERRDHHRIHTGERRYTCAECGMAFTYNQGLHRHKRTHTGEKPYECNTCGKRFTENKGLVFHTRIHTGEKPYVCGECGKGFPRLYALKKHSVKHTGVKAFVCSICGKGFTQSTNRKTHMKIHTNEKSFVCSLCHKKFLRKHDLNKHLEMHSRKEKEGRKSDNIAASSTNVGLIGSKRMSKKTSAAARKKLINSIDDGAQINPSRANRGNLNKSHAMLPALSSLSSSSSAGDANGSDVSDEITSEEDMSQDEFGDDCDQSEDEEEDWDEEKEVEGLEEREVDKDQFNFGTSGSLDSNVVVVDPESYNIVVVPLHSPRGNFGYPYSYRNDLSYQDDQGACHTDDPIPVNEVEVVTSPCTPDPAV